MVLSAESKQGKSILGKMSNVFSGKNNHGSVAKVWIGDQECIQPVYGLELRKNYSFVNEIFPIFNFSV